MPSMSCKVEKPAAYEPSSFTAPCESSCHIFATCLRHISPFYDKRCLATRPSATITARQVATLRFPFLLTACCRQVGRSCPRGIVPLPIRPLTETSAQPQRDTVTPYTWAEKFESFERINSIRETNGNFDSCNSCKRLVPSRLHELHEKNLFVSRIEFIRSKLSNFSAHVYGDGIMSRPSSQLRPSRGGQLLRRPVQWRQLLQDASMIPDTWAEKSESLELISSIFETNGSMTHVTHVNGCEPAVYMSYRSQNFNLFHYLIYPF